MKAASSDTSNHVRPCPHTYLKVVEEVNGLIDRDNRRYSSWCRSFQLYVNQDWRLIPMLLDSWVSFWTLQATIGSRLQVPIQLDSLNRDDSPSDNLSYSPLSWGGAGLTLYAKNRPAQRVLHLFLLIHQAQFDYAFQERIHFLHWCNSHWGERGVVEINCLQWLSIVHDPEILAAILLYTMRWSRLPH